MSPFGDDAPEARFARRFPKPGHVTADEALDELNAVGAAGPERPYTVVNFVLSADGRAALGGRSAPLSDPGDRAVFHGLRERADAVFAGTGTMRTERYGRLVRDPARRERRVRRGLTPDPIACIMTRSGNVPAEIPLFADPSSHVVVFCPRAPELTGVAARVDCVVLEPGELTLTTMMRCLRTAYDVHTLLCEGGPTVFSGLLHEGLVDELCLTVSPWLAGGGSDPTLTNGPALPQPVGLKLRSVLEREGTLFLRYACARA